MEIEHQIGREAVLLCLHALPARQQIGQMLLLFQTGNLFQTGHPRLLPTGSHHQHLPVSHQDLVSLPLGQVPWVAVAGLWVEVLVVAPGAEAAEEGVDFPPPGSR